MLSLHVERFINLLEHLVVLAGLQKAKKVRLVLGPFLITSPVYRDFIVCQALELFPLILGNIS